MKFTAKKNGNLGREMMTTKAHPSESGAGGRLGGRAGAPGVQKGATAVSKPHPQGPLMMGMVPDLAPLGSELLPLLQAAGWRCSVLPEPAWGTGAPPQDARTPPKGLHLERLRGTCAWTQHVPKTGRVIERKSSVNEMSFPLGMSLPRARFHPASGQWSWHLGAPAGPPCWRQTCPWAAEAQFTQTWVSCGACSVWHGTCFLLRGAWSLTYGTPL